MKRLIYVAVCLATMVACSKEQEPVQVNEPLNGSETVIATAKDFVMDGMTKTVISQSGSDAPAFAWKDGDVIGIIPMNGKTVQSNYEIAEIGSNPKNATFDGGVWALKEGKEYAAYYPFKKEALISNESLEFSFLGQTQAANNSLEHLGAYDYMYASAVVPQSGSAQFDFEHKISLVRLQLTVPKSDTYTRVVLESSTAWFAAGASLKLSDGTMSATETVKSATLNLSDIVISAGSILTVWFAMLPTSALNGQTLSVKLFGAENTCIGEVTGLTALKAGSAYSYSSTLSGAEVEYVDLGLPSGLKWASCNLGASKPEEYGGYYQWAGLEDVTDTSIYTDWDNCPYHTGSDRFTGWTKYIPSGYSSYWSGSGSPDNKTVLDPEDDVAHVKLGGKWRMPTKAEFEELCNNCTSEVTILNGVTGLKFTSKKNGNSIFFPAAGYRHDGDLNMVVAVCHYWSSSLYSDFSYFAFNLHFFLEDMNTIYNSGRMDTIAERYFGQSVRPVYGDKVSVTGVSLSKTSLNLVVGAINTLSATATPSNAAEQSVSWSSNNPTVATVDAIGNVTALKTGSATITVKTTDGGYTATCEVTVVSAGHEGIDLSLPSGLKWATCNLGASKPEEYGGYYQWAGLEDVTNTSICIYFNNCPYHIGLSYHTGWTKYVPSDNKTVLDPEDDVAHVKLGGKWRMPTKAEFEELCNNCTSEWTTLNGVNGRKFTSKKNGNSIFFPAAAFRYYGELGGVGSSGYYWSSSLYSGGADSAEGLYFDPSNVYTKVEYRYCGLSVRPVSE